MARRGLSKYAAYEGDAVVVPNATPTIENERAPPNAFAIIWTNVSLTPFWMRSAL